MLARLRSFALLAVALIAGSFGVRAQDPFAEPTTRPADAAAHVARGPNDPFAEPATRGSAAAPAAAALAAPAAEATPAVAPAAVTVTVTTGPGETSDDPATQLSDPIAELNTRRQAAELKIRRELAKSTTVDFVETPLMEVAGFLEDVHQIQIEVDANALDSSGVTTDVPVTCSLTNVSLHSLLRQILKPYDLSFVIDNEVLMITSRDEAQANPEVRVYNVDGLATEKSIDDLIKVIMSTCTPESWKTSGGFGQIEKYQGKLVVRQSVEVQWEITQLLADLRR
jgi:hypothetical protein